MVSLNVLPTRMSPQCGLMGAACSVRKLLIEVINAGSDVVVELDRGLSALCRVYLARASGRRIGDVALCPGVHVNRLMSSHWDKIARRRVPRGCVSRCLGAAAANCVSSLIACALSVW